MLIALPGSLLLNVLLETILLFEYSISMQEESCRENTFPVIVLLSLLNMYKPFPLSKKMLFEILL
jgi:hypothetical protein